MGRGVAGTSLAAAVESKGDTVVGFLDDRVRADDVIGTLADVNDAIVSHDVDVVYFAIPSVDAATVREFLMRIETDRVDIAIIPRTYGILAKEQVSIDDLTDVDVLDLIGREPVKHDLVEARDFIDGKVVLVTGAAGSIGSRLVRQLLELGARTVVGLDFSEAGIFTLASDIPDRPQLQLHVADVRDPLVLRKHFERYRPDVVFHAAAYKHVPLMQSNPVEAFNNNVGGSLEVMRAAREVSVGALVYVSTDKAVNPANVMGATKRIGEMILDALAQSGPTRFTAVRFGNVIESSGSVMQTFRRQIARKQPLTVTDPEVTRFFMTLDEAAQLVIQSAFVGENGDLFVLDMGQPVRILDLAKALVRLVDPTLPIEITGLRPGEKMFEELSYEPDSIGRTANGKIFVVRDAVNDDPNEFLSRIEELLARSRSFALSDDELVAELRAMGFPVQ
ncbi:SDR family NAD(P)-dependent oxidoreductase [Salinibacterium soli]|uniref:SDR family NAD(P)-dependent oxidoreductase n=1 Tax=Antiquaquibacter soli TaxID=3064523 RepID=A0ABT9BJB1_9MICO|nr:SDR family NAD(P)-dependent oxidoreductase [Protaetiibacter sp. WY-16]MDO7881119.1 SDR family NAD(P)-dependent oxidoreductase [Protaetiibacter sp. WY-16]